MAEEVIITKKVNDKVIHYLRHTCSPKCKPLTQDEVDSILSFKQAFDNPIDEVIQTTNVIRVAQIRIITICLDQMVLQNW